VKVNHLASFDQVQLRASQFSWIRFNVDRRFEPSSSRDA